MRVFRSWPTWARAEPELRALLPDPVLEILARAVEAASRWHGDQRRPTGEPYLVHLLETLEVLTTGAGVTDPDVLAAAVLHDVVEDTAGTLEEIRAEFGDRVAELVGWVTIPPAGPGGKPAVKERYLRGLAAAPREALLVKLADRASNVQTIDRLEAARARAYFAQTVDHVVPLAAAEPWFAGWYASWRHHFAELGAPRGTTPEPPHPTPAQGPPDPGGARGSPP